MGSLQARVDQVSSRRTYRLAIRIVALGLAAVALWLFSVLVQERQYPLAFATALVIAGLSTFEFVFADIILDRRFPRGSTHFLDHLRVKLRTTEMESQILAALRACVASFDACDQARISSTLMLRVDVNDPGRDTTVPALFQAIAYTQHELGGRKWRYTHTAKGLVGRCFRVDEKDWVNFRSASEYQSRMVHDFGFTPAEAKSHTGTARSYLAYPLKDGDDTIGVMYFFSTEPQVFPAAASDAELTETASRIVGILRLVEVI